MSAPTTPNPTAAGCLSFLALIWLLLHAPQILTFLDSILAWRP
jgi:hypothetical protein